VLGLELRIKFMVMAKRFTLHSDCQNQFHIHSEMGSGSASQMKWPGSLGKVCVMSPLSGVYVVLSNILRISSLDNRATWNSRFES